jgi:hypothetical protein
MSIDESNIMVTPKRGRPSKSNSPVQQLFAEPVEVDESSLVKGSGEKARPTPKDAEWTDYVLSHLVKGEKDEKNGYPKVVGLKRLVMLLMGEIVNSVSELKGMYPTERGYNASVEHHLTIAGYDGNEYHFTGLGGSNVFNTDKPYDKFPEAIASTRAYGRALRDALAINCVAAEEMAVIAEQDDSDPDTVETASAAQRSGIKNMCKNQQIDVVKLLNNGEDKYTGLEDVHLTKSKAKEFVMKLNQYQGGLEIPKEILLKKDGE